MDDLAPVPENMPDMKSVTLPARAFCLSWQTQTIPARRAALDDALAAFEALGAAERGVQDMALLGVVSDAMQPLEDLAWLATAWEQPFDGLANYLRAVTYLGQTPTTFWQQIPKWTDEQLDVFSGLSARDPVTKKVVDVFEDVDLLGDPSDEVREVMRAARQATRRRLRTLLGSLAKDWQQFAQYFLAFKHGGLAINRDDMAFVDDDVTELTDDTPMHNPSVAVWSRRPKDDAPQADFKLTSAELAEYAVGAGRLAIRLCHLFFESRMAPVNTLVWGDGDEPVGVRPMRLPWTPWLREQDLTEEQWKRIGPGPTISWVTEEQQAR